MAKSSLGVARELTTSAMRSLIAWAQAEGSPDTTWIITRADAQRIVEEIGWGYAAAKRETDLATKLDAAHATNRRLNRRIQEAESLLSRGTPERVAQLEAELAGANHEGDIVSQLVTLDLEAWCHFPLSDTVRLCELGLKALPLGLYQKEVGQPQPRE